LQFVTQDDLVLEHDATLGGHGLAGSRLVDGVQEGRKFRRIHVEIVAQGLEQIDPAGAEFVDMERVLIVNIVRRIIQEVGNLRGIIVGKNRPEQGRRAGGDRRGKARALNRRVGAFLGVSIEGSRVDAHAGGGDLYPPAIAGEIRLAVALIGCRDGDHTLGGAQVRRFVVIVITGCSDDQATTGLDRGHCG